MYPSTLSLFVAAIFGVSSLAAPIVVPGADFSERDVISPLSSLCAPIYFGAISNISQISKGDGIKVLALVSNVTPLLRLGTKAPASASNETQLPSRSHGTKALVLVSSERRPQSLGIKGRVLVSSAPPLLKHGTRDLVLASSEQQGRRRGIKDLALGSELGVF